MSSSTGSDEHIVAFATPWGTGRLALLGTLPFELELPDGAAGRISRAPAAAVIDERGADQRGGGQRGAGERGSDAAAWAERLETYFGGRPVAFPLDVDAFCDAHGFTSFESDVYRALAAVPFGRTVSYRDLAVAAGRPRAWRAVGSAMAMNPLPVVLPCHRVIRSDGRLGEYGDDPAWKARLLELEGVTVGEVAS